MEILNFPGGTISKEAAYNAGELGSIPGSGRFPGEGNDNPLQYSCLENSMDRGGLLAPVHGVAKSQTRVTSLSLFILNDQKETKELEPERGHCEKDLNDHCWL